MLTSMAVADWLSLDLPIIDVRSPLEFARGHVPGAHNLPLFSDEERSVVGTLYKLQGRDAAVLEGLRIVGPKLASIVERARGIAPDGRIRVHCWRGGERSASVAWLLDRSGFAATITLKRGYKAFRAHVQEVIARPWTLVVLGGYTGTGKTETLQHLKGSGQGVVDLEGLAHHKGSSFGAIGQEPQPSTEHFENLLWHALSRTDPGTILWVEDESAMIGRVKIPDAFHQRMRSAELIFAEMPIEQRADRLVADYGACPREALAEAIVRIEKRLGPQHCKAALEALASGDLRTVALISLRYYDKAYDRGAAQRDPASIVRMPADASDLRGLAERLAAHVNERTLR